MRLEQNIAVDWACNRIRITTGRHPHSHAPQAPKRQTEVEYLAENLYVFDMLSTLKAVVEGDRIHWREAVENVLPVNRPVEVLVTVLEAPPEGLSLAELGRRRVAALQKLAALNSFSEIKDPIKWQQETREERGLPGRQS